MLHWSREKFQGLSNIAMMLHKHTSKGNDKHFDYPH